MKPNKQNIINDILIELEKGIGFKECFAVICSNMQLAERTFANYWKEANSQYKDNQQAIKKELLITSTELAKQTLKKAILSKDEILERLTEIGLGKAKKLDGNIIMPTFAEQINAMKTINEMQGYKAVAKTETELKFNKEITINIGE